MLNTLSILSLDQGNLHAKTVSEEIYFARFNSGRQADGAATNDAAEGETAGGRFREWLAKGRDGWRVQWLARLFG